MRIAILLLLAASVAHAQPPKLAYVVILSRHGVRSPTSPPAQLRQYAADPWPEWSAAPGELTEHGRKAMTVLGAWYRAWLAHDALLPADGCDQSDTVHVRADVGQRTYESGRAFAHGLFPGCPPEVQVVSGNADPLFHPVAAGAAHGEGALAVAAVSGRIGANPAALAGVYRHAFETLDEVLGKHGLTSLPASLRPTEDGLADIRGPLRTGSTLAENLLLEYAEGMTGKGLGWGRLDPGSLNDIMVIHTAYADLARRTPYLASVQGSNLLWHILRSMEQAAAGKQVVGALGKPGDRLLILAGHDTNISHVSGLLNLSWLIPGYQRDDTPPGGSLVFRLWRDPGSKAFSVDVLYIAQTLDQLRSSSPLSLTSPPGVANVFMPGCRPTEALPHCRWEAFRRVLLEAIDLKHAL
ncbi:4-phytase [Candidatus Sulfopaludibacter sp. SbA3]|nr:4-phytase [Candidatus Sulfopaludibacter sp. SbA3]